MKIPRQSLYHGSDTLRIIEKEWGAAAIQIGLETGMYVEVGIQKAGLYIVRIFFKFADHEFEDLTTLRSAIKNKAFI